MGKPLFVGISKEIIIPGLPTWCEPDFVHPQYHQRGRQNENRHFRGPRFLRQTHMSHNQNLVLKWSTQNHASRIKKAEFRNYFWLGLPLTNLHLPESVLST